jgi:hypothetical protein
MTPAQQHNQATVTAWVEAYNGQDFDALAALASDELIVDDPATGTHLDGWPAFRAKAEAIAAQYPDRHITLSRMLPLGPTAVAVQADWDATPVGGVHPEHRVEDMVFEFKGGKVAVRGIYR